MAEYLDKPSYRTLAYADEGAKFAYPQRADGSWPAGSMGAQQWEDAEARLRARGLYLHDWGGGYVVRAGRRNTPAT